jgi:hypothetical protein
MRRVRCLVITASVPGLARRVLTELPWKTSLPPLSDPRWAALGKELITHAQQQDTGRVAFDECSMARQQLQTIVQGIGYDMTVSTFGGLATMRMLEAGGDADFVGVTNVEPTLDEAGEIVARLAREMRRLGLRATAIPRARVPVLKVDRASRSIPGSPLHSLARSGLFRFSRDLTSDEQDSFCERMKNEFECLSVEWCNAKQTATVTFDSSTDLVSALIAVDRHAGVPIPLRLPVEPRNGPEIYRHTFDFVLSSIGLQNSHVFGKVLAEYPYSRHLLQAVKKWGRTSDVSNSIDGLLASYALTVMMVHFLCKIGLVRRVTSADLTCDPHAIPRDPVYEPLCGVSSDEASNATVGLVFAAFFEYYGVVFDYGTSVICTTNLSLTKEKMKWNRGPNETGRPPFFELCIKDPCGLDNIGRNLSKESVAYVRAAVNLALQTLTKDLHEPKFIVKLLTTSPPKPVRARHLLIGAEGREEQAEAWHMIKKMEFQHRRKDLEKFGERTVQSTAQQKVAQDMATNMLSWIKNGAALGDGSTQTAAGSAASPAHVVGGSASSVRTQS